MRRLITVVTFGLQVAQRLLGRLAADEQVSADAGELRLEQSRDVETDRVRGRAGLAFADDGLRGGRQRQRENHQGREDGAQ